MGKEISRTINFFRYPNRQQQFDYVQPQPIAQRETIVRRDSSNLDIHNERIRLRQLKEKKTHHMIEIYAYLRHQGFSAIASTHKLIQLFKDTSLAIEISNKFEAAISKMSTSIAVAQLEKK